MTPRFQDPFTSSFWFVSAHPRCWGQHLCCQSSSKEAPDIICKTAHHGGDGLMDVTNKQIICIFSIETLFQWDKARQPPPREMVLSTSILRFLVKYTYYITTISLQKQRKSMIEDLYHQDLQLFKIYHIYQIYTRRKTIMTLKKNSQFKMYVLLNMVMFNCHVSSGLYHIWKSPNFNLIGFTA